MFCWQIQMWEPSVAVFDSNGSFHYYPIKGKKAFHANLNKAMCIDTPICAMLSAITADGVYFLVKTEKQIKNQSKPSYFRIDRQDFNYWITDAVKSLEDVVQDSNEEEWIAALGFVSDLQSKLSKTKKAEAFFG